VHSYPPSYGYDFVLTEYLKLITLNPMPRAMMSIYKHELKTIFKKPKKGKKKNFKKKERLRK